jgi:hypothetical protein
VALTVAGPKASTICLTSFAGTPMTVRQITLITGARWCAGSQFKNNRVAQLAVLDALRAHTDAKRRQK